MTTATKKTLDRLLPRTLLTALQRILPEGRWYLVGGAVRDAFRGVKSPDLDLVVTGVSIDRLQRTLGRLGKVALVGKRFGVVKFIPRSPTRTPEIDVALPRTDHYTRVTGAYRDVDVHADPSLPIEDDLSRRDFTVNAMAYDFLERTLIDPFGGHRDLRAGIIRTVGDPRRRFREDVGRTLRGLRFATQLGAHIHPATWRELRRALPRVPVVVSAEVVAKELVKAFAADPGTAFDWYDRAGAFRILLPEVEAMRRVPQPRAYHREGDVFTHTRLALRLLTSTAFRRTFPKTVVTGQLALTVLLHDIGKPPTLKTPKRDGVNRIRFDGHDVAGAELARRIADRWRLASTGMIDADGLVWVIRHHLIGLSSNLTGMKETTFVKYFLAPDRPVDVLLQTIWADGGATVPEGEQARRGSYHRIRDRLRVLRRRLRRRASLPPPLLRGADVMAIRSIPGGTEVGIVLNALREEQLAGRIRTVTKARHFVQNFHA